MTNTKSKKFDVEEFGRKGVDRRTVMKGAAWSVPVVALAVATPAHAASIVDVGAYTLTGSCAVLGLVGRGFVLTASPTQALPAGTIVTVTSSGLLDIGLFSITGGTASVAVLSDTSRAFTLTTPLAAGASLAIRSLLSVSIAYTLNASTTLPADYIATGGAKPSGSVNVQLIVGCSAT